MKTYNVMLSVAVQAKSIEDAEDYVSGLALQHLKTKSKVLQIDLPEFTEESGSNERIYRLNPNVDDDS